MIFDIRTCKDKNIENLEHKVFFEGSFTFGEIINFYYSIPYTTDIKNATIFPISIKDYNLFLEDFDILEFLGKNACNKIAEGNAILVFHFVHEAIHFKNFHTPASKKFTTQTINKFKSLDIDLSQVWFVTGDLDCVKTKDTEWNKINMIGIDFFSHFLREEALFLTEEYYNKFKINKEFENLYLNANPRPTKCMLYHSLIENNLLKKSHYSWMHRFNLDYSNLSFTVDKYSKKMKSEEVYRSALRVRKLDTNEETIGSHQDRYTYDFLEKTSYSLVPETFVINDQFFITEKTYKPIFYGHPFLIWGNTGILNYLKELGYQTYDEIFDESYDKIFPKTIKENLENNKIFDLDYKLEIILDNVINFKDRAFGKEKIVNEICMYNKNHFLTSPEKDFNRKKFDLLLNAAGALYN